MKIHPLRMLRELRHKQVMHGIRLCNAETEIQILKHNVAALQSRVYTLQKAEERRKENENGKGKGHADDEAVNVY